MSLQPAAAQQSERIRTSKTGIQLSNTKQIDTTTRRVSLTVREMVASVWSYAEELSVWLHALACGGLLQRLHISLSCCTMQHALSEDSVWHIRVR
jgi:hypothetical protein